MNEQMKKVLDALDAAGIAYELMEHPPVHTIEDMDALGIFNRGEVCKNLFLRNANGKVHYIVSMCKDKHPDIQGSIKPQLGSSRLSFGSPERLEKHLGLQPGSVTPFGVLNNDAHDVKVVFDRDLLTLDGLVGFHPNVNTAFVWLKFSDLLKFIEAQGNEVIFIRCER